MKRPISLFFVVSLVAMGSILRPVAADCQVNGAPGINGTAGNDTIVCDNNPAPPTNIAIGGGAGGDDNITVNSNNQSFIAGDGNSGMNSMSSVGVAGNDTIVVNGTTNAQVYGDYVNGNVNAGNDNITINGRASNVHGDYAGGTANGGNDTIIINGTVTNSVNGDTEASASAGSVYTGGDDTIIVNGTTGNVNGDALINAGSTSIGGYDTITINSSATVNGNVTGETGATVGGNDTISIAVGATITGTISGGNAAGDFDILKFIGSSSDVAGYNQIQSYVGCTLCSGSVTIDGHTYTFTNFEQLQNLITLNLPAGGTPVSIAIQFDDAPDDRINWKNGDWLAPIYNYQGAERGLRVELQTGGLWIPEAELPVAIPTTNTLVACNSSSSVCVYQLADSGYWQVNVNTVIQGQAKQTTVTFDSLTPSIISSR